MKSFDRRNTSTNSSSTSVELFTPKLPLLKLDSRASMYNLRKRMTPKPTPSVTGRQRRSMSTRSVVIANQEDDDEEDENLSVQEYSKPTKSSSSYYYKLYDGVDDVSDQEESMERLWQVTKDNLDRGIHFYCETHVNCTSPLQQYDHMFNVNKKVLGEGQFGKVFNGFHRKTGQKIAVKVILKSRIKKLQIKHDVLKAEVGILQSLDHEAIVKLMCLRDTSSRLFIVMEGMYGDMYELIDKQDDACGLDESLIKFIFIQVLSGVHYLHSRCIVHCDLKPENVLVSDYHSMTPMAKICDFGFARFLSEQALCTDRVGTPIYSAPEVIKQKGFNKSSDMWSLGILLYVALTGSFPFKEDEEITVEVLKHSFASTFDSRWAKMPKAGRFVMSLMMFNKEERLRSEDCFNQPWLQDTKLISNLLKMEKSLGFEKKQPKKQKCLVTPNLPSIKRSRAPKKEILMQEVQKTPRRVPQPRIQSILPSTPRMKRHETRNSTKYLPSIENLPTTSKQRRISTQTLDLEEEPVCKKKRAASKRLKNLDEAKNQATPVAKQLHPSAHQKIEEMLDKDFQTSQDKFGWIKRVDKMLKKYMAEVLPEDHKIVAADDKVENVQKLTPQQVRAEKLWTDANYLRILNLNPQLAWEEVTEFLRSKWQACHKRNKWMKLAAEQSPIEVEKSKPVENPTPVEIAKPMETAEEEEVPKPVEEVIQLQDPIPSSTVKSNLLTTVQSSDLGILSSLPKSTVTLNHSSTSASKSYVFKPKRARNAYQFWQGEHKTRLAKEHPKINGAKMTSLIAKEWKKVADRSRWVKMAADEKEAYKKIAENKQNIVVTKNS